MTDEEISKKNFICSRHFSKLSIGKGLKELSSGSLPTVHLPGFTAKPTPANSLVEQLEHCQDSEEIQTLYEKYSNSPNNRRVLPEERVIKTKNDNDAKITEERGVTIELEDDDDCNVDNDENKGNNDSSNSSFSNGQKTFENSANSHWLPTIKSFFTNEQGDSYLTDVCRICLRVLFRGMKKMSYSEVIKGVYGMKLKQMLEEVLPFLEINAYANAYFCSKCLWRLNTAYKLKQVERKTDRRLRNLKRSNYFADQPLLILAEGTPSKPAASKKIVRGSQEAMEDSKDANKNRKIISLDRVFRKSEENRTKAAASSSVNVSENLSVSL